MGLIIFLPVLAVAGVILAGYGLWSLVVGRAALAEGTIRGGAARLLGVSLLICGAVCLLGIGAYFNARWPILACWRYVAAGGLLGAAGALIWAGCEQKQRMLLAYGAVALVFGSLIVVPSTVLASLVYQLTGDKRFKSPDYGR